MNNINLKHARYDKLRGKLKELNIKYEDLAKILGISTTQVGRKINGYSDFYLNEAVTISNIYGIEVSIFLPC